MFVFWCHLVSGKQVSSSNVAWDKSRCEGPIECGFLRGGIVRNSVHLILRLFLWNHLNFCKYQSIPGSILYFEVWMCTLDLWLV